MAGRGSNAGSRPSDTPIRQTLYLHRYPLVDLLGSLKSAIEGNSEYCALGTHVMNR